MQESFGYSSLYSPRCGAPIWLETMSGNKMGHTELIDASEVTDQCSSISEQHQMLLYRTQPTETRRTV